MFGPSKATLESEIYNLRRENSSFSDQISCLERELKQKSNENKLLNDQINYLRTKNHEYSSKFSSLRREVISQQTHNSDLQKTNNQLTVQLHEAEESNIQLTAQLHETEELDQTPFLQFIDQSKRMTSLTEANHVLQLQIKDLKYRIEQREQSLHNILSSNLTALPWLAGVMADYLTYDLEIEAKKLDWGANVERQKKVASIRDIRADAQRRIAEAKLAVYQLNYLLTLYPQLEDILETDYKDLNFTGEIPEHDPVRDYLSKEEWKSMPEDERNQLALDRYIASHKKSKWQIGRDYELAVSYQLTKQGFEVDSCGSYLRLEDMGRDIIATKGDRTYIVQCKYWSSSKQIHENHIAQLYGTTILYALEKKLSPDSVVPVLVTNIEVSPVARMAANFLGVTLTENYPLRSFPRIKCNIGRDEFGKTYIYHLPMDAQYDNVKIDAPGECYAFTVQEAVEKGFRRAYKWHGI